jgi:hypothetical protein
VCERAGHDVAKLGDVAHVNPAHSWINRKSPTQGSVFLLLWSKSAHKVLVVKRRDDERMVHEPCFPHHPVDLGLAGKVGNVELAAADRFDIRQR